MKKVETTGYSNIDNNNNINNNNNNNLGENVCSIFYRNKVKRVGRRRTQLLVKLGKKKKILETKGGS